MKIALVTGASSGLGKEMIIQIADRFSGIDEIWAIARRKERMVELRQQLPVPLRIFALDLMDKAALAKLERALAAEKADVKILVNAAGYGKIGGVGDVSLTDEMGMVQLNCVTLCGVTHLALPYMSRNSRIIHFASSAAFLPQPRFAIYAATKAFVLSYSRALNRELRERNIFVTAVCPGPVRTEFFDVAETTGKISYYKKFAMVNPKKVVKSALQDSMMGKEISVYGSMMKAFFLLTKIIPHNLLLSIMEWM